MTAAIDPLNKYNRKPPLVSVQPTDADKAYAAGFFDGEGTVMLAKGGNGYRLFVAVGQKDIRPLQFLKERFSGTIHSVRQPSKDRIYHWQIGQYRAELFLRAIYPYLIHKKEQVKVALDYRDFLNSRPTTRKGLSYLEIDRTYRDAIVAIRAKIKAESQCV